MSGAVAAHAAYNGSGTQGLAVTNKIQDQEGDVMSVFWNKNDTTRQLLHGSTILEVPASGNNGNVDFSGTKIFTINNDIDCLGELYLNMKVNIDNKFTASNANVYNGSIDIQGTVNLDGVRTLSITTSTGTGYTNGETVELVFPGGVGAEGTLSLVSGAVASVTITKAGYGYTGAGTSNSITLKGKTSGAEVAKASVSAFGQPIKTLSFSGGTSGDGLYNIGDEVTLIQSGSDDNGKAIVTSISSGDPSAVRITNAGSGYNTTSSQTVKLRRSGQTANEATATYNVFTSTDSLSLDPNNPKFQFKLGALTNIIERIEYQVGTQIWQTLEKDDVRVVYNTEMSEAAYNTVSRRGRPSNSGSLYDTSQTNWVANSAFGPGDEVDVTFIIPALTKTLAPQLETFTNVSESGYPLAAAPHQSIKIKVYLANTDHITMTVPKNTVLSTGTHAEFDVYGSPYISKIHYLTAPISGSTGTSDLEVSLGQAPLGIKSIKLYAKHLIMCNEEREQMKAMPLGLPKRLKMTQNSLVTDITNVTKKTIDLDHFSLYGSHLIISGNLGKDVYIKNAELKLNSSSFSGVLPAQMLDYAAASSLGLYVNRNIEEDQSEALDGVGILVFPLSSSAYSGSSVPLNRFDSIRLTLEFTGQPISSSNPYISITCIGETTALFKGGAASLAMY